MKKNTEQTLWLLSVLLSLMLTGCDSLRNEVDPSRLNKGAEKLVVAGFISPQDTILAIQVSRSVAVLGQASGIADVSDATVTISDGTKLVALRYAYDFNKQGINLYWADARSFPIIAGRTYTLTVETPNGQKVNATCTVPMAAPQPTLQLDSTIVRRGVYGSGGVQTPLYAEEYTVRARWTDFAGQENYYRVSGLFRAQLTTPPSVTVSNPITVQNIAFQNYGLRTDSPSTDGAQLTSREGRYFQSISVGSASGTPATDVDKLIQLDRQIRFGELIVSLLHTDESYYRYHDAITRQQMTDGNPFAEPVQVPSNINGGLGCFAGYNRSTVVVRVK